MARLTILLLLLTGCAAIRPADQYPYHSPLSNSRFDPLLPRRLPSSRSVPEQSNSDQPRDIRPKMVAQAKALLKSGKEHDSYFVIDLETILDNVSGPTGWQKEQGLTALVSIARKKDAFHSEGRPIPGDIALFHNQFDANANSEADDWLTGCGIVVDQYGQQFDAIVRTGHAPRQVTVWPDGPAQRIVDGKKANDFLRVPDRSDPKDTAYLAGQLYAGHIDIEKLTAD